jgi:hypothetical protein
MDQTEDIFDANSREMDMASNQEKTPESLLCRQEEKDSS